MQFILPEKRSHRIAALAAGIVVLIAMFVTGFIFNWPMYIMGVIPALMAVATCFAVGVRMQVKNWYGAVLLQLLIAFVGFFLLHFPSLNGVFMTPKAAVLNGLMSALILFLLQAITGRIKPVGYVWMAACLFYGILNHAVYMFRGSIININDFGSVKTALSVAGNYTLEMHPSIFVCLHIFVCGMVATLRSKVDAKQFTSGKNRLIALVLAVIMAILPAFYLKTIKPKLWRNRAAEFNGILLEYIAELSWLDIEAPEGYSHEAVDEILSGYVDNPVPNINEENPHIIAVMVEAYSDLTVLGNIELTDDVMKNFNALKSESMHGYACASIFGGNTAISEWEFLTANSMAYLPGSTIPYR